MANSNARPTLFPGVKVTPHKFMLICALLDLPLYFTAVFPLCAWIAYRLYQKNGGNLEHPFFFTYAMLKIGLTSMMFSLLFFGLMKALEVSANEEGLAIFLFVLCFLLGCYCVYNLYVGHQLLHHILQLEENKVEDNCAVIAKKSESDLNFEDTHRNDREMIPLEMDKKEENMDLSPKSVYSHKNLSETELRE